MDFPTVSSTFNFPFQLTLGPVLGAIAAGNTVVIKPSENAPCSAAVLQKVCEASLDPSCYSVLQGGVPETQVILAGRWDKIFFTGGANVGRIIAKVAAPHLTPVVLELGGINPAIVTKTAGQRLVARRMLWGKVVNAGQVYTSQNYMFVDKSLVPRLVEEYKQTYKEFYPKVLRSRPARIINENHFQRLKSVLDNSKGKILLGGTMDAKELFIKPTVVQVNSMEDSLCTQENYDVWVHRLPITSSPGWIESIIAIRYPPYAGKLSKFKAASTLVPEFGLNGQKLTLSWLRFIMTLGGGTVAAGAGHAAVIAVSK